MIYLPRHPCGVDACTGRHEKSSVVVTPRERRYWTLTTIPTVNRANLFLKSNFSTTIDRIYDYIDYNSDPTRRKVSRKGRFLKGEKVEIVVIPITGMEREAVFYLLACTVSQRCRRACR